MASRKRWVRKPSAWSSSDSVRRQFVAVTGKNREVDLQCAGVVRFGLTGHPGRELSWTMMRQIEDGLAHLFGEKWMEKR